MDLLSKIRQGTLDTATANQTLATAAAASVGVADSARVADSASVAEPLTPWLGDWSDALLPPPRFTPDAPAGPPWLSPAPHVVPDVQPARPPSACATCQSPFFWEDLAGELHCCECVPIFSRRAAVELWRLVGAFDRVAGQHVVAWAEWTPRRWNPFGHLEAAQAARQEREAATAAATMAADSF